jgi:hypothetical protein
MAYRVTYPLIEQDGYRDFDSKDDAEAFARVQRELINRFRTIHSWRIVQITEVVNWKNADTPRKRVEIDYDEKHGT